jgi:hypothetical protein
MELSREMIVSSQGVFTAQGDHDELTQLINGNEVTPFVYSPNARRHRFTGGIKYTYPSPNYRRTLCITCVTF